MYFKCNWVNRISVKVCYEDGKLVEVRLELKVRDVFSFMGDLKRFEVSMVFVRLFREWFGLDFKLKGVEDGDVEIIEYFMVRKDRGLFGW